MRLSAFRLATAPGSFGYLDGWNVTYDTNGNVNAGGNNNYPEGGWTYTYDNLNRLVTATSNRGTGCQYSYDTFGNRLSEAPYQSGTCFNSSITYSGNRISAPGYLYDAAGNLQFDGTNTYTYDAESRLSSITNNNGTVSYQYGSDGNRTGKTIGGVLTKLGYDPFGRFMWTNYGSETPQDVYFNGRHLGYMYVNYGPGTPIDETLKSFTYSDVNWLGSEIARFDGDQKTVGWFYQFPFGDNLTTVSGTDDDTLHFTGKERDVESGNDYFGARYYSSSMGRFMSPDIVGGDLSNPQTLNLYAYVLNNPLKFTDWFGFRFQDVVCTGTVGNSGQETTSVESASGCGYTPTVDIAGFMAANQGSYRTIWTRGDSRCRKPRSRTA